VNFEIIRRYVDDVVLIDDDVIADALRELLVSAKLLAEPGGAAATAAVLTRAIPMRDGQRIATVVSGGNIALAKLKPLLGWLDASVGEPRVAHRHHRADHRRNEPLTVRGVRDDVAAAHGDRFAGAQHAAVRHDAIAPGRREHIDLELDAQNSGARRHQRKRCVAAGAVGDGGERAGVQKTVLLRQVVAYRQLDVDLARLDAHEASADRLHEPLAPEAAANAALELGILRFVPIHAGAFSRQSTQIARAPRSTARRRSHEP